VSGPYSTAAYTAGLASLLEGAHAANVTLAVTQAAASEMIVAYVAVPDAAAAVRYTDALTAHSMPELSEALDCQVLSAQPPPTLTTDPPPDGIAPPSAPPPPSRSAALDSAQLVYIVLIGTLGALLCAILALTTPACRRCGACLCAPCAPLDDEPAQPDVDVSGMKAASDTRCGGCTLRDAAWAAARQPSRLPSAILREESSYKQLGVNV